jgi:hypothetical protein
MSTRFVLTINLGNEEMNSPRDAGALLCDLGRRLIRDWSSESMMFDVGDSGALRDVNGNRVGGWHVDRCDAGDELPHEIPAEYAED